VTYDLTELACIQCIPFSFLSFLLPYFPILPLRFHPHSTSSLHPHHCFFLIIILPSPSCALLHLPHIFCRYYGIAIVNSLGKKLKMPKGSVTITYQIHRYSVIHLHSSFMELSVSGILLYLSVALSFLLLHLHPVLLPHSLTRILSTSLTLRPLCPHIHTHTHREGLAPPLAYTPLSEAWSDHLFYFSTLSFKRSGNYTVSFLVEVRQ
jgi:hypothetical protein